VIGGGRASVPLQPTPDMKSTLSLLIAAMVCFTALQAAPHSLR
jgi:hypothetical protein